MPDYLVSKLAAILQRAHAAAVAADPGEGNDGGTCNMDTPAFRIDRVKETTIQKAANLAGVEVMRFGWLGRDSWYWLRVPLLGQGNRRSTMMKAAQKVLNDSAPQIPGFHACGYYQMD